MSTKRISQYFYWEDVIRSETAERLAIDNTLPIALELSAVYTASKMDTIRNILGTPIYTSSWYRCLELNRVLGSQDSSDHVKCLAVDWRSPDFGTPAQVAKQLLGYKILIGWEQLILEHSWIHVSFQAISTPPKLQVLSLLTNGKYAVGLTDKFGKSLA